MDWLTREQIDQVLEQLSADDLIEASDQGAGKPARVGGLAFHLAATRVLGPLPEPERWTSRVRAGDFKYLSETMGDAVNIGSPLSSDTSELLASQDSGESLPETSEDSPPATG